MNVNLQLGREFEKFVKQQVKSGAYPSVGEVVRDGLRLLQDREALRQLKLKQLRKDIAAADEQFRKGKYRTYTADDIHLLTDEIKREGRKRLASDRKKRNEARTAPV